MRRLLIAVMLLAPLDLATARSRSSAPPPEKPGQHILYTQLSPVRWRIGMKGDGAFDPAEIDTAVLRKAAKLSLTYGFDWFEPIGERAEPVESADAVDPRHPLESRAEATLVLKWGRLCVDGWKFGPDPRSLCPAGEGVTPAFQATTQIVMGHGLAPRNGLALNARTVLKSARRS
jgi:hypothetical protein